jgi:hypothetical protein
MKLKNSKSAERSQRESPTPIASAGFSPETLVALKKSAERLKQVPARAFSKAEIEQFFNSI